MQRHNKNSKKSLEEKEGEIRLKFGCRLSTKGRGKKLDQFWGCD